MGLLPQSFSAWLVYGLMLAGLSANAQVQESFSDGSLPARWQGDTSAFRINADQRLQLNASPDSAEATLYTRSSFAADTLEWRLWLRLDFSPSDQNKARFYLATDTTPTLPEAKGYFLQIGENGQADGIDLYRKDSTAAQRVIDGQAGFALKGLDPRRIRVRRFPNGQWQIAADSNGRQDWIGQGQTVDQTYNQFSYTGIQALFTSTRADRFYFDDFYQGPFQPDTTPPALQQLRVVDSQTLRLVFSEPVTDNAADQLSLSPGNRQLSDQSDPDQRPAVRDIRIDPPLSNKTQYQLVIDQLADQAGNQLTDTVTFSYVIPAKRDILIHELMPDPNPSRGLPAFEYVELYNTLSYPVKLQGWQIADPAGPGKVNVPFRLPPKGYAVIGKSAAIEALEQAGVAATVTVTDMPTLNNGGEQISLISSRGDTIHQVSYKPAWYRVDSLEDGGYSLEMINPLSPCKGAINWRGTRADSGGTPGRPNSVENRFIDSIPPEATAVEPLDSNVLRIRFSEPLQRPAPQPLARYVQLQPAMPLQQAVFTSDTSIQLTYAQAFAGNQSNTLSVQGLPDCWGNQRAQAQQLTFTYTSPYGGEFRDIVINEFMADPTPSQGLPTYEYVELLNRSNRAFSLDGWQYGDDGSTVALPDTVLPADAELLLVPDDALRAFGDSGYRATALPTWPTLNNGGDALFLRSPGGQTIDSLNYDDTWYQSPAKADGGWALEQVNPDHPCSGPDNWRGSTDTSGGTPGQLNAVFDPTPDTTAPGIADVEIRDSQTLAVTFSERVVASSLAADKWQLQPGIAVADLQFTGQVLIRSVTVALQQPMQNQTPYDLTYQGVRDCWGNALNDPDRVALTYLAPEPAQRHDVLITELMPAPEPPVALPAYEYIELRNVSDKVLALQDQQLLVDSQAAALPKLLLRPDTSVILTDPLGAVEFLEEGQVIGVQGLPPLINSEGRVTLRNQQGELVHTIAYRDAWYNGSFKEEGGWSLEMVDLQQPCAQGANWKPSDNPSGGTPGRPNSVAANNPLTSQPVLEQIQVIDSLRLQLRFSKRMDSLSLVQGAYQLAPDLAVDSIIPRTPLFRQAKVVLEQPAKAGQIYTLQLTEITDCLGNRLPTTDRRWGLSQRPEQGDLKINEILFNPSNKGADFVELLNTTDEVLSLNDLRLANRDDQDQLADPEALPKGQLLPGKYLVVSEAPDAVSANFRVKNPLQLRAMDGLPTYPNAAGDVVLYRKDGTVLDEVAYKEDWHTPLIDDPAGVSLERISPQQPSDDPDNWQSAAETAYFGTPTYENSQSGQAAKAEGAFSLSSKVFSPDQDGYRDFLRIQYELPKDGFLATITIYDTKGRKVRQLTNNELLGREGSLKWDGTRDNGSSVAEGVYILQGDVFHPDGDKRNFQKSVTVGKR